MSALAENYHRLLDRIGEAAVRSGREPGAVRLLAVSKRVRAERILEAIELGVRDIGENRVQEVEQKMPLLAASGVRCHLIGHLQSNKARRALELCDSIQSVDTTHLAMRLDRMLDRFFPVFIEVRSGDEPTKHGVSAAALGELVDMVRSSQWLKLQGLMTVPPFSENPNGTRPHFRRLRELGEEHHIGGLSMGMSHDFEVAIEEGATDVRIGTALFGARQ